MLLLRTAANSSAQACAIPRFRRLLKGNGVEGEPGKEDESAKDSSRTDGLQHRVWAIHALMRDDRGSIDPFQTNRERQERPGDQRGSLKNDGDLEPAGAAIVRHHGLEWGLHAGYPIAQKFRREAKFKRAAWALEVDQIPFARGARNGAGT